MFGLVGWLVVWVMYSSDLPTYATVEGASEEKKWGKERREGVRKEFFCFLEDG